MRKTRLREVRVHHAHQSVKVSTRGLEDGALSSIQAGLTPNVYPLTMFWKCSVRIGFSSSVETASITGKIESTTCSTEPGGGRVGWTTWQLLYHKATLPRLCLNSVCTPNWTEGNCPICWQNRPPWLQRTPTLEGEPPGVQREMEMEALAGHTASACHPSWLLFESKALHHPTPSLRRPNIPKAQILFEVDVLLFTRPAAEAPGLEEGSPRGPAT